MEGKKVKNFIALIVTITFILSAIYLGLFYVNSSEAIRISKGIESPYTVEQVETMMRYHGALVAKFQGGKWLFLKDGQWIAIENGNALEFALRTTHSKSPSL